LRHRLMVTRHVGGNLRHIIDSTCDTKACRGAFAQSTLREETGA
jgi:hypothetical protein